MDGNATRRRLRLGAGLAFLAGAASLAPAWDNHEQLSALALAGEAWAGRTVKTESLEDFLGATKGELAGTLSAVEIAARADYKAYRPLPAALTFDPALAGKELRDSFVGAIRVNPNMPFALFLQVPVGGSAGGRPALPPEAAALGAIRLPVGLVGLAPGEPVSALEVVESACDEPDYGMDWGLYEDNGTAWGARYGFGIQPWGNPKLSYGTQAPFHMSFDNEPGILRSLAKWTTESNVGYRIDLYTALARFAFAAGHEYWGWRFAGWALHYVQDLAQPYHASIMPSKTTFSLLLLNAFGSKAKKDGAVTLLSNRHLIFENYQYSILAAWKGDAGADPAYAALVGRGGAKVGAPTPPPTAASLGRDWALKTVAAAARRRGPELDRAVVSTFPAKYVDDPGFDFGAWQDGTNYAYDPHAELVAKDPGAAAAFDQVLAKSLAAAGEASRAYMGAVSAALK